MAFARVQCQRGRVLVGTAGAGATSVETDEDLMMLSCGAIAAAL